MVEHIWTPEDIDELLEVTLPCETKVEYERALVKWAGWHGRSAQFGLEEGDQILRRRANRCTDYTPPADGQGGRTPRGGLVWGYAELRLLGWAKYPNPSESKAQPTPAYLAGLLARPVAEVEKQWKSKPYGLKGFFDE